jgi:hypothetical protein
MEAEKILEGLSQEERLELLERLIQGATQAQEESLTTEERVKRLEESLWGGRRGFGPEQARYGRHFMRGHKMAGMNGCQCSC